MRRDASGAPIPPLRFALSQGGGMTIDPEDASVIRLEFALAALADAADRVVDPQRVWDHYVSYVVAWIGRNGRWHSEMNDALARRARQLAWEVDQGL